MISRKTVLILGAGASKPYGLPTGLELRDHIRAYADIGSGDARLPLFKECGIGLDDMKDLGDYFRGSGMQSIDAYLERHPTLIGIGKYIIAYEIARRESPGNVIAVAAENWYEHMWEFMVRGLREPMDFQNNPLDILTFNYDRSLECFLFTAIKKSFRVSDEEALIALQTLRIEHAYGNVGAFHYNDLEMVRTYGGERERHSPIRIERLTLASCQVREPLAAE